MLAQPASATWLKATSKHFIVYADDTDAAVKRQATELENFDALLRHFQGVSENPDAEFNRVTVYVLPSIAWVTTLAHNGNVAGFYIPRVTGSIAFTPRAADRKNRYNEMTTGNVLLHEYAHHFMLGNTTAAYPTWFTEGYAEFVSSVELRGGTYWMGAANQFRAYSLTQRHGDLSARQMFAPPRAMDEWQTEALYARGWALTHMVEFDPGLRTQFNRYLVLLNTGTPGEKAATQAFGDLGALDARISAYVGQKTLSALPIKADVLPVPEVEVRPLTSGEAALIRSRIVSTRGVDRDEGKALWKRGRDAAAAFPADPVAQGWLAEMAFDAGEYEASEKAADAALAADPRSSQALFYKARVHLARLTEAKSTDTAAWTEARSWIIKANRAQPNDAAALALFYESFGMQRAVPSKGAVAGLYRAVDLVPQFPGTRVEAARQSLADNDMTRARAMLRPVAFDPHSSADNPAARVLAAIDAGADARAALDVLDGRTRPAGAGTGAAPAKAGH